MCESIKMMCITQYFTELKLTKCQKSVNLFSTYFSITFLEQKIKLMNKQFFIENMLIDGKKS